jgi:hypothetical protein
MKNCAQPKEDKIIAAIIPAFNEATRIEKAIIDATPFVDHIVVVDDCSHDRECPNFWVPGITQVASVHGTEAKEGKPGNGYSTHQNSTN